VRLIKQIGVSLFKISCAYIYIYICVCVCVCVTSVIFNEICVWKEELINAETDSLKLNLLKFCNNYQNSNMKVRFYVRQIKLDATK
jgi:hypothetical protein